MRKYLSVAVYAIAALLFVAPIAETLFAIAPWRLGEVRWRFGAVGLVSRSSLDPVLGLLLAFVMAWSGPHRIVLRLVSVVATTGAVLFIVSCGLFVLDALQVRAALNDAGKAAVMVAAAGAALKLLLVACGLGVLGVCAHKSARRAAVRQAVPPPLAWPAGGG